MPDTPAAPRPTRRSLMQGGLAVVATLPLAGCGPPSMPTYRYRLKVEVDTPQGLRTGSSVIEVTNRLALNINGGGYSFQSRARGEAVAVDLPGGRTLFALLSDDGWFGSDWAGRIVYEVAPYAPMSTEKYGASRVDRINRAVANRSVVTLPPQVQTGKTTLSRYPMLVTFRDTREPATVTRVDPDDLTASFGSGVKLRRITVQITDDPITTAINRRLGWLGNFPEPSLDPSHAPTDYSLPATLTHGDFRKGPNG